MKSLNNVAALLGAGLMSAASLLVPGAALAEDTYTISEDLMAECVADGLSKGACECIIGEISDTTGITEFDLDNIEGAADDYVEVTEGEEALEELFEDCVADYPA